MTTHQRLIAARREIVFNNAFKKHPYVQENNLIQPDIRKIILERDIIYPIPTTPESFDGEKKKGLLIYEEMAQWEVCPTPKYKIGDTITDGKSLGVIHKINNHMGVYVYCIWREDKSGNVLGNACIKEPEVLEGRWYVFGCSNRPLFIRKGKMANPPYQGSFDTYQEADKFIKNGRK